MKIKVERKIKEKHINRELMGLAEQQVYVPKQFMDNDARSITHADSEAKDSTLLDGQHFYERWALGSVSAYLLDVDKKPKVPIMSEH